MVDTGSRSGEVISACTSELVDGGAVVGDAQASVDAVKAPAPQSQRRARTARELEDMPWPGSP